jgi:hypothetical protein
MKNISAGVVIFPSTSMFSFVLENRYIKIFSSFHVKN